MASNARIFGLAVATGASLAALAAVLWPSEAQAETKPLGIGSTGDDGPQPSTKGGPSTGGGSSSTGSGSSSNGSGGGGTGEMSDSQVFAALVSNQMPAFLRDWKPVTLGSGNRTATIFVSPDYLGIGNDSNYLRTPMKPATAQRLADTLGFVLPTKKMVEAIEAQARLAPFHALTPNAGETRNSLRMWNLQNGQIASDIGAGAGQLYAGQKKDIVGGGVVGRNPGKVIIFGGKYSNGARVQPQSAVHSASYVDYSHGVRMVRPDAIITENGIGRGVLITQALSDPALASLFDDGPSSSFRYAT